MRKKKIRCYKTFINDYPGVKDFPVYYLAYEGWSSYTLATCLQCGELFVIDWENPKTKDLSSIEVAGSACCPTCNSLLKDTMREYPKTIKLPNGKIGTYVPTGIIPPDEESLVLDFFEITPE